eukprot:gb/GFBE01033428.1/.p1 GENE.gb/GFBE01033428.1/~~gb/GFBE01033428.1/.p1  ORF type:complete len:183 (+),score=23.68 gb/GFBE01033428.1/:1-549(+)
METKQPTAPAGVRSRQPFHRQLSSQSQASSQSTNTAVKQDLLLESTRDATPRLTTCCDDDTPFGGPSSDFSIPSRGSLASTPPLPSAPKPRLRRPNGYSHASATCPDMPKIDDTITEESAARRENKAGRRLRGAVLKGRIEEHKAKSCIGLLPVVLSDLEDAEEQDVGQELSDTDDDEDDEV